MMIASDFLSTPLKINDNLISVLCIENKVLFRDVVGWFTSQDLEEHHIIFSDDSIPFKSKGDICFVDDFYNLSLSSAITKKLYENISRFCYDEMQQETNEIKSQIISYFGKLIINYEYDLEYTDDFNLVDLFKVQGLKPSISTENLLNSLLDFLIFVKKYTSVKCFVLLNLHLFFTEEELDAFYKGIIYNHIPILVLENIKHFNSNDNETVRIIDNDLCEIIEK